MCFVSINKCVCCACCVCMYLSFSQSVCLSVCLYSHLLIHPYHATPAIFTDHSIALVDIKATVFASKSILTDTNPSIDNILQNRNNVAVRCKIIHNSKQDFQNMCNKTFGGVFCLVMARPCNVVSRYLTCAVVVARGLQTLI